MGRRLDVQLRRSSRHSPSSKASETIAECFFDNESAGTHRSSSVFGAARIADRQLRRVVVVVVTAAAVAVFVVWSSAKNHYIVNVRHKPSPFVSPKTMGAFLERAFPKYDGIRRDGDYLSHTYRHPRP